MTVKIRALCSMGIKHGPEPYQDRRVFVVKRPRVVVADDNQAIRESVNRLLAADFDVVATVSDGQAAFEAVVTLQPEAVVLDISMPPSNGFEIAKKISALTHPPRIVFLSVHEGEEFLAAARKAGASGYVFKRNAGTDLIRVLNETLGGQTMFPEVDDEPTSVLD